MKIDLFSCFSVFLLTLFCSPALHGQTVDKTGNFIEIKGTVVDDENKEALPFANILVTNGKTELAYATSDFDGNFKLRIDSSFSNEMLEIKAAYVGRENFSLKFIPSKVELLDIVLAENTDFWRCDHGCLFGPIMINPSNPSTQTTWRFEDIRHMPRQE